MHDAAHDGLVSITAAAARLTGEGDRIDRSGLSRYVARHSLSAGTRGRQVLVDFEQLRAHRRENYTRELMGGQPIRAEAEEREVLAPARRGAGAALQDSKARVLTARATREEIETAELIGTVVDSARVEAAAADAIVALRRVFAGSQRAAAARICADLGASPDQERKVRARLKERDRQAQTAFAQALGELRGPSPEAAEARVRRLAAAIVREREGA